MNSEFSTICLNVSCKYSRNCVVVFVHLVVFCREILILVVTLFFDNRGLRGDEMGRGARIHRRCNANICRMYLVYTIKMRYNIKNNRISINCTIRFLSERW